MLCCCKWYSESIINILYFRACGFNIGIRGIEAREETKQMQICETFLQYPLELKSKNRMLNILQNFQTDPLWVVSCVFGLSVISISMRQLLLWLVQLLAAWLSGKSTTLVLRPTHNFQFIGFQFIFHFPLDEKLNYFGLFMDESKWSW